MEPINISLSLLGKKFGPEWIFRKLDAEIKYGEKILISGGNGSGKSTLLQVISGYVSPSEGEIKFTSAEGLVETEETRKYISFASPYLQLIEDFTLAETVEHAAIFKPYLKDLTTNDVIGLTGLSHAADKFVKQFSSGMKQRLKLSLAILSDTPLLLLDEPVSNLDKAAIQWYKEMIARYTAERTVIVCSNNIEEEHFFCTRQINISDFKIKKAAV
jgi:ABC-type multidrug transport system ATPase subunit